MRAKRRLSVFSLSFLDVMSCGFGAVVLIFLIINHDSEAEAETLEADRLAELRLLDYQVQTGERDRFQLLERLDALNQRLDEARKRLASTVSDLDQQRRMMDEQNSDSTAEEAALERLKTDVAAREAEVARLRQIEEANEGGRARAMEGEGDRQYLTGLRVGGEHILIAVDVSASMLDHSIVNVLRRRNMPEAQQKRAPKWRRTVRTVEWLASQLPLDANFQILAFNTRTFSLAPDGEDRWTPLGDGQALESAITALEALKPGDGSQLSGLIAAINRLNPAPDNIYLITDSLPTQGDRAPRRAMISGRDRLDLFSNAIRLLPAEVPVNVILFPMEGDPLASAAYWNLARTSGGAFLAPSRDWP